MNRVSGQMRGMMPPQTGPEKERVPSQRTIGVLRAKASKERPKTRFPLLILEKAVRARKARQEKDTSPMEHFKILFPPTHNRVLLLKHHRNRQNFV